MSPSWDVWLFMTTQRILSSLVLTIIITRDIHCLSIPRAFWSIINYCSRSIDLSISFRWFSIGTPSTSSRNWGSRRGYLTFMLGIIYIIGMTSKYTVLCTSIIRFDSLQIGHTGSKLTFSLTLYTLFFYSGCYRAQRGRQISIVVESVVVVWEVRESVYNSSSSLLSSASILSDKCLKSDETFDFRSANASFSVAFSC